MKFKILKGTELFSTLQDVQNGLIAGQAAISDELKQMGFTGQFASGSSSYLLSCDAVEIKGDKPDGWKVVGEKWQSLYYPKQTNKAALKKINAMPQIKVDALNKPLNFSFSVTVNLEIYHRPGFAFHKDYILIETGNATYKPVEGMIEILESEYNSLYSVIKEAE